MARARVLMMTRFLPKAFPFGLSEQKIPREISPILNMIQTGKALLSLCDNLSALIDHPDLPEGFTVTADMVVVVDHAWRVFTEAFETSDPRTSSAEKLFFFPSASAAYLCLSLLAQPAAARNTRVRKKKNARQDRAQHARGEPRFVRKFFKAWLVPTVRPPETPFQTLAVRIGIRYMVSSPNSHEHGVAWRRDNNHDGGSDGTDG